MSDGWEMLSGKFAVVATLLHKLRQETTDRIVIVSNYTQTLDLFQTLCRTKNVSLTDFRTLEGLATVIWRKFSSLADDISIALLPTLHALQIIDSKMAQYHPEIGFHPRAVFLG